MKGIAITLATREDGEAIDRIEKLIGHKIPRAAGKAAGPRTAEDAREGAKAEPKAEAAKPASPRAESRAGRARPPEPQTGTEPAQAPNARRSSRTSVATGTARCRASFR